MSVPNAVYPLDPPSEKIIIQRITSFTITSVYLNPFNSAVVNIRMFDENNIALGGKSLLMEGEDYQAWSNDDSYLITFVEREIRDSPTVA